MWGTEVTPDTAHSYNGKWGGGWGVVGVGSRCRRVGGIGGVGEVEWVGGNQGVIGIRMNIFKSGYKCVHYNALQCVLG